MKDAIPATRPGWQFEFYNDEIAGDTEAGYYTFEFEPRAPMHAIVCRDDEGQWSASVVLDCWMSDTEVPVPGCCSPETAQEAAENALKDIVNEWREYLERTIVREWECTPLI